MDFIDPRRRIEHDADKAIRQLLKPLFALFEADRAVTEVNVNGPEHVFVTRNGRRESIADLRLEDQVLDGALVAVAHAMGQECEAGKLSSIVNGKLPGFRFAGVLYPIAACGTSVSIRRHSPRVRTMEDYVTDGAFVVSPAGLLVPRAPVVTDEQVNDYLIRMVREGRTMLVSGGTDTGKTTFLNMLCRYIPEMERVGSIEDTREVTLLVENWLPLEYSPENGVTATDCVKAMLRFSPDRIVLGEMRDEVAAAWLEAGNTGHDGNMATVHASSAYRALERVELLVMRAGLGWPIEAIRHTVATTVDVVIQLKKTHSGDRVIAEIAEVDGFRDGQYVLKTIFSQPDLVGR